MNGPYCIIVRPNAPGGAGFHRVTAFYAPRNRPKSRHSARSVTYERSRVRAVEAVRIMAGLGVRRAP